MVKCRLAAAVAGTAGVPHKDAGRDSGLTSDEAPELSRIYMSMTMNCSRARISPGRGD